MIKEKITIKKENTAIAVTGGEVKSVRFGSSVKTGYRVYSDGKIGVSGIVGDPDDAKGFKKAEENLSAGIPYPAEPGKEMVRSIDARKPMLGDKEFVAACESLLKKLTEKHDTFVFSNIIKKEAVSTHIQNDAGLDLKCEDAYYSVGLLMKEKSSANIMDLFLEYAGRDFDEEKLLAEADSLVTAYYKPADIEPGEYPVIYGNFIEGAGKIIESARSDMFATGSSLFSGKLGQKLFSEDFTMYEDHDPSTALGECFFDAEGTVMPEYRFKIIDKGVFCGVLAAKTEAAVYGLPCSGSAVSEYDGVPMLGSANYTAESSGKTVAELIGDRKAVYIIQAAGGDTTPTGDFAAPVQTSFLVEGGKFVGRLPDIGISGNIFDMFGKNFLGVATDSLCKCPQDGASRTAVAIMNVTK